MSRRCIAWAVLGLGLAVAVQAAPPAEDITFGAGLVDGGYPHLAVEVLEPVLTQLEPGPQRTRAVRALEKAHRILSRYPRRDLPQEEEQAIQARHADAAAAYRDELLQAGPEGTADTFDGCLTLFEQARRLEGQFHVETDAERKNQIGRKAQGLYVRAVQGLQALTVRAQQAVQARQAGEPNWGTKAWQRWSDQRQQLQEVHLRCGVELNRVRFALYKANAAITGQRDRQMLDQVVAHLGELCHEYDGWAYSVLGYFTLGQAYMELRRHKDARVACEAAIPLMEDMLEEAGENRKELLPWHHRLLATWALAATHGGDFDEARRRIARYTVPEVRIALGEIHLIRARRLDATGQRDQAEALRRKGREVLARLAEVDSHWQSRVGDILKQYGGGAEYIGVLDKLAAAVRGRDNLAIIEWGQKALGHGESLSAEQRSDVLAELGAAYRRERMHFEAHTVYAHLAAVTKDDEQAEKHAGRAVAALRSRHRDSGDAADRELFDAARKWQRDRFGGPGAEYSRGAELKADKRYPQAIEQFRLVRKDSLYYESALEQIGECYVLEARRIEEEDPARSKELLKKGQEALEQFLEVAKRPTRLPRVARRRKQLRAAAVYRLATIHMWEGSSEYGDALRITEGYAEEFPEATLHRPYVSYLRVRAQLGLGEVEAAARELEQFREDRRGAGDSEKLTRLAEYAEDLVFRAYGNQAAGLRKEADKKEALAKNATAEDAEAVRREARALRRKADAAAATALRIVQGAVTDSPDQPFEKYQWLIYELIIRGRWHDLRPVLEAFQDRYGDLRGLTPEQREFAEGTVTTLGVAYYQTGRYESAWRVLSTRFGVLDREWTRAKEQDPNAEAPEDYWYVRLHVAHSSKALAIQAEDDDERQRRGEEALRIYGDIRKGLERFTREWWDVTVSMVEVQDTLGRHADNLPVLRRLLVTRPALGGSASRGRAAAALAHGAERATDLKVRKDALDLLVQVRLADLKELAGAGEHAKIVEIVTGIRNVAGDFGSAENRRLLRPFVEEAAENTPDDRTRREAEILLNRLSD